MSHEGLQTSEISKFFSFLYQEPVLLIDALSRARKAQGDPGGARQ